VTPAWARPGSGAAPDMTGTEIPSPRRELSRAVPISDQEDGVGAHASVHQVGDPEEELP
jgi:hypothetical protein